MRVGDRLRVVRVESDDNPKIIGKECYFVKAITILPTQDQMLTVVFPDIDLTGSTCLREDGTYIMRRYQVVNESKADRELKLRCARITGYYQRG